MPRATVFFRCPPTARIVGPADVHSIGRGHSRARGAAPASPRRPAAPPSRPPGGRWADCASAADRQWSPSRASRVLARDRHGLFGEVSAGANHRPADGGQQQVVQRGVGSIDAQIRIAGGDDGGIGKAGLRRDVGSFIKAPGLRPGGGDWGSVLGSRRSNRIGASWPVRTPASSADTSQCRRTSSSEGNIRAKGRSGRRFLCRSSFTASALVASARS